MLEKLTNFSQLHRELKPKSVKTEKGTDIEIRRVAFDANFEMFRLDFAVECL